MSRYKDMYKDQIVDAISCYMRKDIVPQKHIAIRNFEEAWFYTAKVLDDRRGAFFAEIKKELENK